MEMIDFDGFFERFAIKNSILNKRKFGKKISVLLNAVIRVIYPCDISPYAHIGNIKIPHALGIVVGHSAIIEDDCILMSNVVIGGRYGSRINERRGHAHIKHNCIIGANSTILGKIQIGEYSIIGSGSVITKDVPPKAVVVGNNQIIRFRSENEIENTRL